MVVDKPPLAFYLNGLSVAIFGVSEFALRLPTLLASTVSVALVLALGRSLYGEMAGHVAAWALALSPFAIQFSITIFVDPLLTTWLLAGMFLLSPSLSAGPKKSDEHKDKETPAPEKAKSKQKSDAYYHFSSARLLEENGDFSKAIDEYKKAIQNDPQSPDIYIDLANAYLRHRRVRDAVQEALPTYRDRQFLCACRAATRGRLGDQGFSDQGWRACPLPLALLSGPRVRGGHRARHAHG
jgi:tetratricopeptide (TPR) repeat protein